MFAAGETIKYKQLWVVFVCVCVLNLSPVWFGPIGGGMEEKRGSKALKLEQTARVPVGNTVQ